MFLSKKHLATALVLAVSIMSACGGPTYDISELGRFECSIRSATCFGVEWDKATEREIISLAKNQRAANSRNSRGETPLHWAARFGKPYTVGYLLAGGASPESRTKKGQTPLHWAAYNRNPDVSWRILHAGRTIHNARDEFEKTALHIAVVKNSNPNVAAMLLRYCVDPHAQDKNGDTAWDLIKKDDELFETDPYWVLHNVVELGEKRICERDKLPWPKVFTIDRQR